MVWPGIWPLTEVTDDEKVGIMLLLPLEMVELANAETRPEDVDREITSPEADGNDVANDETTGDLGVELTAVKLLLDAGAC
jgi:hypothetical protein